LENGLVLADAGNGTQWLSLSPQIWYASLLIGLAAVVDFLDGFVARLLKASSELGKQLDSLADVVSFGVAPSLIIYHFLKLSYAHMENGLSVTWWALTPAFLVACAAAYRLAVFNLATDQQFGFKGVPTPAIGLTVASFPMIYFGLENQTALSIAHQSIFWYVVIAILSFLMVSQWPLMAFKVKDKSIAGNLPQIILVLIAVVGAILLQWIAVPVVFITYIALSLAFKKKTP
jgi:CDP-diacylglycerol--serine O-phosphatidyltransferase